MNDDRIFKHGNTEAELEPEETAADRQLFTYTDAEPNQDDGTVISPTVLSGSRHDPPTEEILHTLDQIEAEEKAKRIRAARKARGEDVSDD